MTSRQPRYESVPVITAKEHVKKDWAERAAERWLDNPATSKYSAYDLAKLLRRIDRRGYFEGMVFAVNNEEEATDIVSGAEPSLGRMRQ